MSSKIRFIIFFICISFSIVSANAEKCIRGYEPSELEIIEAKKKNEQFHAELHNLAVLVSNNPQNEFYKSQFDEMNSMVLNKANKFETMISKVEIPSDLAKCDEASLGVEDFKNLERKWRDISGSFPISEDIVYNYKLVHDLALFKAGFHQDK